MNFTRLSLIVLAVVAVTLFALLRAIDRDPSPSFLALEAPGRAPPTLEAFSPALPGSESPRIRTSSPAEAVGSHAEFSGRVRAVSGAPLSQIEIRAVPITMEPEDLDPSIGFEELPDSSSVRCDAEGTFVITGVRPRWRYEITASSRGYVSRSTPRTVLAWAGRAVEIPEIVLEAGGSVTGSLVSEHCATGIASVHVEVDGYRSGVTSADGTFWIDGLAPGAHELRLRAEGQVLDTNGPLRFEIVAGEVTTLPPQRLRRVHTVKGVLVAMGGAPISAGSVQIRPSLDPDEPAFGTVDDDGHFEVAGLSRGSATLTCEAPGYEPVRIESIEIPAKPDLRIELEPKRRLKVAIQPPGAIAALRRGVVRSIDASSGRKGPPVHVEAATIRTSAREGVVELALDDRADCELALDATGYSPLTVHCPQDVDLVTATFEAGGSIRGHAVLLDEGESVPAAHCRMALLRVQSDEPRVTDWSGVTIVSHTEQVDHVLARSDGRFEFTGVAPGRYVVRAKPESFGVAQSAPIDLIGGSVVGEVHLTATKGSALFGGVFDARGLPVIDAVVVAQRSDDVSACARTDPDGQYRFEHLAPGRYTVQACAEGLLGSHRWGPQYAAVVVRAEQHPSIDLVDGRAQRLELRFADVFGTIGGLVTRDGDSGTNWVVARLPDVAVDYGELPYPATIELQVADVQPSGRFELGIARAGAYPITVRDRETGTLLAIEMARVAPGVSCELRIEIRSRDLTLQVLERDSSAVPGAVVIARRLVGDGGSRRGIDVGVIQTDAEGRARLSGIPVGSYAFEVQSDAHAASSHEIELGTGNEVVTLVVDR
ncbi:MAG: carboxypeptidase regulatory-like domain-containing protein [Planctomycetes bacterium]|nr:carboxypeptidase regulatory-like domain-containing protein [Planctomycetota bacterium]MCC7172761.1 carboxypeptidase regulatory-like domain-containing protein [Planctomycetota bacterium]